MQRDQESVAIEGHADRAKAGWSVDSIFREIGTMIDFALENPDRSQVPLVYRDRITQEEWDAMSEECRRDLQARVAVGESG